MADLSFQALASSEHVLSSAENFVLYVLLEAVAGGKGGAGSGSRLPLNLGVVIDRSGSMYDERRLEFVIEAVKFLADNLTADDKVSIVAFADKAKVLITPEAARDKRRGQARDRRYRPARNRRRHPDGARDARGDRRGQEKSAPPTGSIACWC